MRFMVIAISSLFLLTACKNEQVDLKQPVDRQSYAIGHQIGMNLKNQNVNLKSPALYQGIKDALENTQKLTKEEIQTALSDLQKDLLKNNETVAKKNLEEGKAFLEKNKSLAGVKTLPSGLQVLVLKEGKGKAPKKDSQLKVHYVGTLVNGTEFDSTIKKNMPAILSIAQAFPGWKEGIALMKEGGKMKMFIPSELAYGKMARPGIPPNSTLIFEVELLEVK